MATTTTRDPGTNPSHPVASLDPACGDSGEPPWPGILLKPTLYPLAGPSSDGCHRAAFKLLEREFLGRRRARSASPSVREKIRPCSVSTFSQRQTLCPGRTLAPPGLTGDGAAPPTAETGGLRGAGRAPPHLTSGISLLLWRGVHGVPLWGCPPCSCEVCNLPPPCPSL